MATNLPTDAIEIQLRINQLHNYCNQLHSLATGPLVRMSIFYTNASGQFFEADQHALGVHAMGAIMEAASDAIHRHEKEIKALQAMLNGSPQNVQL